MSFQLVKAKQVAEMLGCTSATVYSWARRGELPCVPLHKGTKKETLRFRVDAIERFIASRSRDAS